MSGFLGGSAYAMSRDIAEGYVLVTERTFRGMQAGDLSKLSHEIERYMRELRGAQVSTDEIAVIQARARKVQRLNGAMVVLRAYALKTQR